MKECKNSLFMQTTVRVTVVVIDCGFDLYRVYRKKERF